MFWFLIILMPEENMKHNNWKDKMSSITRDKGLLAGCTAQTAELDDVHHSCKQFHVKLPYSLQFQSSPDPSGLGWELEKADIPVARVQLCPLYTSVLYSVNRK